jgi:hypothetical protein
MTGIIIVIHKILPRATNTNSFIPYPAPLHVGIAKLLAGIIKYFITLVTDLTHPHLNIKPLAERIHLLTSTPSVRVVHMSAFSAGCSVENETSHRHTQIS